MCLKGCSYVFVSCSFVLGCLHDFCGQARAMIRFRWSEVSVTDKLQQAKRVCWIPCLLICVGLYPGRD